MLRNIVLCNNLHIVHSSPAVSPRCRACASEAPENNTVGEVSKYSGLLVRNLLFTQPGSNSMFSGSLVAPGTPKATELESPGSSVT